MKVDIAGYIIDTRKMLGFSKGLIELDSKKSDELDHVGVLYSTFLRLRGVYISNLLIRGQKYSKHKFERWLKDNLNISKEELEKAYDIYKKIRDDKKVKISVSLVIARKIVDLLEKEVRKFGK